MARPTKKGLDYFSVDIGIYDDNKIKIIKAKYGLAGEGVFFRLMKQLYGADGYYLEWDETAALLFGSDIGLDCDNTLARDVVNELVCNGFFNKAVFDMYSVLTSANIQNRYITATSRRKGVTFFEEYLLTEIPEDYSKGVNVNIISVNADINGVNACNNPQSKVKESIKEDEEDLSARAHETFSSSFGRKPTPAELDYITRTAINLKLECLLKFAIKLSASFGADTPSSYIAKVLEEWNGEYIRTADELEEYRVLCDCRDGRLKIMSRKEAQEKLRKTRAERKSLYMGVG